MGLLAPPRALFLCSVLDVWVIGLTKELHSTVGKKMGMSVDDYECEELAGV